jgi:rubrerythrin
MSNRETIRALSEALEDEYKARATYRKVIERFGPTRPFLNIVDAEQRHVEALLRQFERLGETPPADEWSKRVAAPESLSRACADAVEAEIQNDAMYARLLQRVSDPQVREVMLRLQEASRSHHLPAFRRCLERETRGGGRGQRGGPAS